MYTCRVVNIQLFVKAIFKSDVLDFVNEPWPQMKLIIFVQQYFVMLINVTIIEFKYFPSKFKNLERKVFVIVVLSTTSWWKWIHETENPQND